MITLLVIGVALWMLIVLVVIAVCRAAQRGDEALMIETHPSAPAAFEDPAADPTPARALDGRRRLHDRARPALPSIAPPRPRRPRRRKASRR